MIVTEIDPTFTNPLPLKGHLFWLQISLHQGLAGLLTALSKSPPSVNCLRAADVHQPRPSAAWSSSSRACWPRPGAWAREPAWCRGALVLVLPGAGEPAGSNCLAGKHANTPLAESWLELKLPAGHAELCVRAAR